VIWLLRALSSLVALLSWRRAQALGAFLGLVWFHALRIRRGVVRENLALALPHRGDEHAAIAREAFRNVGINGLELLRLRTMPTAALAALVRVHDLQRYEAALARGRGVIVVTAHIGNFDLLACTRAMAGVPLAIVSRELHAGGSNRFWMETREASGLRIFPERAAPRRSLRWLREGRVLGIVVDQRTGPERGGIRVPFFGREVWTSSMAARLAERTGAALLPVRIRRADDGTHDVLVEPELADPSSRPDEPAGARTLAACTEINRVVERWISDVPGQWLWLHRRFLDTRK